MTIPDGTEEGYYWVKFRGEWKPAMIWKGACLHNRALVSWRIALADIERIFDDDNKGLTQLDPRLVPPEDKPDPYKFRDESGLPEHPVCEVCEAPLTEPHGYAGTGMCGPCATGEADTHGEY